MSDATVELPIARPADAPHRPCPVCGARAWQMRYRGVADYLSGERFDVYACGECRLGLTHPIPPPESLHRYYPARYRGNRHGFTDRYRVIRRSMGLASHFPRGFRGRLLDVGCGAGSFALHQQRLGWKVSATEFDPSLVEQLRANGIDAWLPQDAVNRLEGPFDAVTCWHVLEHVDDLRPLLAWVRSLLQPDGVFQVGVPNFASHQARLFGRHWLHLDVPRHFYHFTPAGLARVLEEEGLTITSRSSFVLEYDWFGIIQSALNLVCRRRNLLFERLTCRREDCSPASGRDLALSWTLGPLLAAASLPTCFPSWWMGRGASLSLTCRRTVGTRQERVQVHYRMHRDPMSSHQQVTRLVRELGHSPVLDVGAAQGIFGQLLADSGFTIDAIEPNPQWAQAAEALYRKVYPAYIENADLPEGTYRTLICADVLEHTPDPVGAVRRLRRAATADALFIVSVPNVAHLAVRIMLLLGMFPKMERGILDKTHLQFYTRTTALQMLKQAGLKVERVSATPVPLDEMWRGGEGKPLFRLLAACQRLAVRLLPKLFAMQWIFVARPDDATGERP